MKISIIVAIDEKRGIGKNNRLPWDIPDDLKRFRRITKNHPIIMGRKTFESIGKILPNRVNIIITRDPDYKIENAMVCYSLKQAVDIARSKDKEEIFIIGGGQIYEQALSKGLVDKLYLTIVRGDFGADTFFPDYSDFKKLVSEKSFQSGKCQGKFLELER